jgi:hypothetical protein
MAIISREALKNIVKECLIEILQEGVGTIGSRRPTSQVAETKKVAPIPKRPRQSPALLNAIKEVSEGNALMAEIFADTAKTTLPNMLSEGSEGKPSLNNVEQFNGTPEAVFGEAASTWADLAFAAPKNPGAGVKMLDE